MVLQLLVGSFWALTIGLKGGRKRRGIMAM